MIDHVTIRVSDLRRLEGASTTTVLAPLGTPSHGRTTEQRAVTSWGDLSICRTTQADDRERPHRLSGAQSRDEVEEFHRVALEAGYRDNGPPGERRYHKGYYGAFVLDPDGNNVEAVFHDGEQGARAR